MVKYGYENTATKMNETNKQNLKAVFDDMCKYTTDNVTEKKAKEDKVFRGENYTKNIQKWQQSISLMITEQQHLIS